MNLEMTSVLAQLGFRVVQAISVESMNNGTLKEALYVILMYF